LCGWPTFRRNAAPSFSMLSRHPQEEGTEILRNSRNYSPSDATSLLRRLEPAPASLTELKTSHNRKITVYVMTNHNRDPGTYRRLRQSVHPKSHHTYESSVCGNCDDNDDDDDYEDSSSSSSSSSKGNVYTIRSMKIQKENRFYLYYLFNLSA